MRLLPARLLSARLLSTTLLATAALAVGACQSPSSESGSGHGAGAHGDSTGAAQAAPAAYSDARFLSEMTAHHRMAVEMAEMAPTLATSAELKAMAATMATDQTREIAEMERLLATIGEPAAGSAGAGSAGAGSPASGSSASDTAGAGMAGMDHGAMGHGAMDHAGMETEMGMPMSMADLRAARPFDRAFLVSMIGHHAAAVTMAAEAQAHSGNPDVLRLARAIVTAQAGEIARMQQMVDAMGTPAASSPGSTPAIEPADSTAR